jgi:hypothetical protein
MRLKSLEKCKPSSQNRRRVAGFALSKGMVWPDENYRKSWLTILSLMNHVIFAGGKVLSKVQLAMEVSPAL